MSEFLGYQRCNGIFVGHGVGADGVAAVNIVVPIYQIMSGIGLMIGAGCSVVTSIHLSRQNTRVAQLNVSQAIILTSLFVGIISALAFAFPVPVAKALGASDTLMPQVVDYLRCIMPCYLFDMWSMIGLFIIRLDGSPRYAMWCNIVPSVLNVVLDWLFIFPLGMGVKGAAIATSLSIIVGGIMALVYRGLPLLCYGYRLLHPQCSHRRLLSECGADKACHDLRLPARPCPARPLLHPPAQTARHRGYMACHAGSRVYDLSHHTSLLPQKKMPKMNDTALAIMLIGAYLPPRTIIECVYASLNNQKSKLFNYLRSLKLAFSLGLTSSSSFSLAE